MKWGKTMAERGWFLDRGEWARIDECYAYLPVHVQGRWLWFEPYRRKTMISHWDSGRYDFKWQGNPPNDDDIGFVPGKPLALVGREKNGDVCS